MLIWGDRIAQLVFEKTKTPEIKEVTKLEGTDRGSKGYGSSGISAGINEDHGKSMHNAKSVTDQDFKTERRKVQEADKPNRLAQERQIISVRQIQKLAKGDNPVFLAIIRTNENSPDQMTRRDKRIHRRVATLAAAHGLTESQKRTMNKGTGPNKNTISVAERERQVLDGVPIGHRENLKQLIQDLFPEQLPQGIPPSREVKHHIDVEPGSKSPYRPPYRLGPAEQDELEE